MTPDPRHPDPPRQDSDRSTGGRLGPRAGEPGSPDRPGDRRGGDGLPEPSVEWTSADERRALAHASPELAAALERLATIGVPPANVPPGLVDRIYATSVAMLPLPTQAVATADASRWSIGRRVQRWAPRLAMAASIGLALLVATPFASILHRPVGGGGAEPSLIPTLFADALSGDSTAEPLLVSLLCDRGDDCWVDLGIDDAAGTVPGSMFVAADPEVDSLMATRRARFSDLAIEFDRIIRDLPSPSGGGGAR